MTPEEARRLLEGTTPGPWKWRWDTGVLSVFDVEEEPVAIDLDVGDSDLIAAAPVLASMIAGMHTEYAIEHQHIPGGQWHQVTGWSHEPPLNDGHTPTPDERIVRRYVTEPEEA